jgi:hypothetical protein
MGAELEVRTVVQLRSGGRVVVFFHQLWAAPRPAATAAAAPAAKAALGLGLGRALGPSHSQGGAIQEAAAVPGAAAGGWCMVAEAAVSVYSICSATREPHPVAGWIAELVLPFALPPAG